MRIAGAQLNLTVGDLEGNRDLIIDAMARAEGLGADAGVQAQRPFPTSLSTSA